ncbi:hypothetical protein HUO13_12040 [Saccharopolyspora erythraea]|uniref:hypothetical protein n=1 Tax=Saccharopolyspora erythraea TaxID=1836 RepID=UPI001BA48423|nr:hypothetical protein [Saccharopolyspora erythraea]QUH01443.1 hypothetical protein HUO13_12040 [Saccharopolyspora erythraea]
MKVELYWTNPLAEGEQRITAGSWHTAPEVDTAGMYRWNVGGATYTEIPYAGRWRVRLDVGLGRRPDGQDRLVGAWLKLNDNTGTVLNADTIAYDTVFRRNPPGMYRLIVEADRVFSAGDHVSPGFWNEGTGGSRVLGIYDPVTEDPEPAPKAPTYFTAEYIGPN